MGSAFPASVSFERLQAPFESASDALARFDERLRSSPVAEAFVLRAHFHDACAALWRAGEFVQLEDLVLHDAGTDVRTPTHELVRAHAVLLTRRRIADCEPGWALTTDGLANLRGAGRPHGAAHEPATGSGAMGEAADRELDDEDDETILTGEFAEIDELLARTSRVIERSEPPPLKRDDSGLVYDEDWDEEARLAEWRECLGRTQNLPPLMAASVALDAWEEIEPLQRSAWLGPLLAAALLRSRGKTRHCLTALHSGFRQAKYRRAGRDDFESRLVAFACAIETMAKADSKELDRLTLARELLLRKCKGRRANSRMPQLVDLCLASPVVTVPFAAKELRVSQQAATTMIGELSSNLRELTGRGRYRAWAVV
ncbi:DNA binding protein with HTH domain [Methylosinus sp. sav-2]|uniref:RHE_PE00001 family protein n=1 Tax=Methylosinus sp. sav-2 TaxID=2485168 RepID=UPI00047CB0F0|nr:RHE_PE00001 family protein [Methylosinus sp. sav-2]TDX60531.1 DNA binding protein with HTH domain [Methylosinus sp. sav-2]